MGVLNINITISLNINAIINRTSANLGIFILYAIKIIPPKVTRLIIGNLKK